MRFKFSEDEELHSFSYQNLDIQYTVGLATGVPVTFVSVGNDTNDGALGFLDIVEYFLNKTSPPQV